MAEKSVSKDPQFTYSELISQTSGFNKTILKIVLSPGKKYTKKQVQHLIKGFERKEVKN